jgi:hypothetical protein
MKQITNYLALIRLLRNAEHFDMFENIVEHVDELELKPAALQPAWTLFAQLFEKEDEIYKRSLKQVETHQVNTAHDKRRMAYMGLKRSIEAATYSDDASLHDASMTLMEALDNYADAYYAPMTEVSALFFNMVQDLRKPRYAVPITTLGLGSAVDRLERDNEAFKAIYVERTYNQEELKNEGSMRDIRRQVDEAAVNFTDSVNVFYRTNELQRPADPDVRAVLEDIILFFNSFIHRYRTIVSRRNPKLSVGKDNDKPMPGEDDTPSGDELPLLAVARHEIIGSSSVMSGLGAQMAIEMSDPAAFAALLYPIAAEGGILRLKDPTDEQLYDYPVASFLTDESDEYVGLVVDPYAPNVAFEKPFYSLGPCEAEVVKDGETLALLDGLEYPATVSAT